MADKEERIYVNVYKEDPCKHCADLSGECCEFCEKRYEWDYGKKRAEVIEKTAKADWIATVCAKNQCVPVDITKQQWDEEWEKLRIDYKKVYYAGAEAALKSLLEE